MQDLRLTILQTDLHWQNADANRDMMTKLISAEAANADLIVLPETFTSGFTMSVSTVAESMDGASIAWLRELSAAHNVDICGSMIVQDNGSYYNRLTWASADNELHTYDKRHLFRMVGERDNFAAGDKRLIVTLGDWRICPMICYDLRFPVWSRNRGDYDLLLYVANWPASRRSAWDALLPARAVENLCYVAGANRTGTDGNDVEYDGASTVIDYLAHTLAVADAEPTVLRATLSMDGLQRYRKKFLAWKDADAFELTPEHPDS